MIGIHFKKGKHLQTVGTVGAKSKPTSFCFVSWCVVGDFLPQPVGVCSDKLCVWIAGADDFSGGGAFAVLQVALCAGNEGRADRAGKGFQAAREQPYGWSLLPLQSWAQW